MADIGKIRLGRKMRQSSVFLQVRSDGLLTYVFTYNSYQATGLSIQLGMLTLCSFWKLSFPLSLCNSIIPSWFPKPCQHQLYHLSSIIRKRCRHLFLSRTLIVTMKNRYFLNIQGITVRVVYSTLCYLNVITVPQSLLIYYLLSSFHPHLLD
jgi:hypothetical protein